MTVLYWHLFGFYCLASYVWTFLWVRKDLERQNSRGWGLDECDYFVDECDYFVAGLSFLLAPGFFAGRLFAVAVEWVGRRILNCKTPRRGR